MTESCRKLLPGLVLLLWCIITTLTTFANPAPMRFKRLSLHEGLSQSPIFSIKQDARGFIWIGSRDGLTRYDGYEFKLYNNYTFDKNGISHRDINAIFDDFSGNIWIGTSSGLYQLNLTTETYTHISTGKATYVSCFLAIDHARTLAGTNQGLIILDHDARKVKTVAALGNQGVRVLLRDRSGIIWAGLNNGLYCLNASFTRKTMLPQAIQNTPRLLSAKIVAIKQDRDGDLWFGTEDEGIFWYSPREGTVLQYTFDYKSAGTLLSNFVRDLYVDDDQRIWIATRNGLSIFDKKKRAFTNYQHHSEDPGSLSHNTLWNIMRDEAGSVWLTTYAGGLNVYHRSNGNFTNITEKVGDVAGLNQPVVNALLKDETGDLWVGTDGGGLNLVKKEGNAVQYFDVQNVKQRRFSNIIKSIARGNDGQLWLGTLDGIATFNKHTGISSYLDWRDKYGRSLKVRINALLATAKGIWAASDLDGIKLVNYDGKIQEFRAGTGAHSLSSDHTNALQEGAEGRIWIGTNNGLDQYDPVGDQFVHYQNDVSKYGFNRNVILTLFLDSRDQLWIGTRAGLELFDTKKKVFYHFDSNEKIADCVVESIAEDTRGNLWVGSNNGLYKISFNNYRVPLAATDYKITSYSSADGLASNQFMPNAVAKGKDGSLFFGGVNGISFFNPEQIVKNMHKPKVIITDFMIHNQTVSIRTPGSPLQKPIESTSFIKLKYNQNFISFKLAALDYINSANNRYEYRLFGRNYDDQWHRVNGPCTAGYTDLRPGRYTLKVKAASNDGVWNNDGLTVTIEVLPPLWQTWWAYTLYFLVFSGALILVIRFFRRQAKLERDLYYEHLQYERQQELHQMKLDFFTNISHELRTPLTLLSAPVEEMMEENRNNPLIHRKLQGIQNNTNRLMRLINELMDFRKAEDGQIKLKVTPVDLQAFSKAMFDTFKQVAEKKEIAYYLDCPTDDMIVYFDEIQMEKVLFNLLSNAFKFTPPGGLVSFRVADEGMSVGIYIHDNGPGIAQVYQEKLFTNFYQAEDTSGRYAGSGVGLALSKKIIELHHGTISFQSVPETAGQRGSTCFGISLLKGKDHFGLHQVDPGYIPLLKDKKEASPEHMPDIPLEPQSYPTDTEKAETVLVVEDNAEVREFLLTSLKVNYNVYGCEDGARGREIAVNIIPDLIISDVMMPVMDGLELCTNLKQDERTSHIPIILLTAKATIPQQISGLTTGADAYITKPFSLQLLKLNIHNLLSARKVMRQKYGQQIMLEPQHVVISTVDEVFLSKLMKIVEANLDDSEFDVTTLAEEIGMSRPVLYRKIKGLTDLSVADFIKSIRLKKSVMLLVQTEMNIADIASAVGFGTRKHFSKEFRKQYGCSPSEYADQHKAVV